MDKVKIVHSSDFHFDTPFKEVGEKLSEANKEELKEVFKKIIYFCKDNNVDILLLAGDIFDNYTINKETIYFIEATISLIPDIKVFISPGNHDPYGNNSFYKLINWPKNVYIFKDKIEKVYIKELNVNIWGAAFTTKHVKKSLLEGISNNSDIINIMVIHGEVSNSSKENEYNPMSIDEIKNSNMEYIALGHRHSFSGISREGNTHYAYSGCPQGRGFDELGDKGIICGYIYKGGVDLKFYKTSIRNYEEAKINITGAFTYEEIRAKIIEFINENLRKTNFYKIILEGEISDKLIIDENILKERIKNDFYFCKIIDKTNYKYNFEELSKGYSIKSIFLKKLIEDLNKAESDEEKEIINLALKLGITSLSEGEVKIDDY